MQLKYPNRQKIFIPIVLLSFILLANSCKKFVQIPPPNTEIVSASVFNNSNTVTSALTAIYSGMYNNGESYNIADNQGFLADELTNYSTQQAQLQFYTNSLSALDDNGQWVNGYNYIYQANNLIEGLQNNANISPAIAQQITGEAKFIRAFWHFYLTIEYGAIPFVTTTDYKINQALARTPQPDVYTQIITDLNDAASLLSNNYVDESDTTTSTDRIRPNKGAAEALLARAYLYAGKYDSAKIEATNVIANGQYQLCTDLSLLMNPNSTNFVFMANSTEAIWQLGIPQPQGVSNTADATNFILTASPNNYGNINCSTISTQLFNAFDSGDQRKTNWIGVYTTSNPTVNYYFPYKYQSYNTNTITEYTMVLRLAEQYLIRAEAEANLGDIAGATNDLNVIRARAGLPPSSILTASSSLQQADSAILHERQVELFTEWGHRWFDLNRTGAVTTVMGPPGNVCHTKGGTWNSDWQLYPLSHSEIGYDKNLSQNPGY